MTRYPIILNGDHAEFEREHANTPPKERPDWPLPSFDARDWAEAFCTIAKKHGHDLDEGWMTTWFSNALMRGYDEHASRVAQRESMHFRFGIPEWRAVAFGIGVAVILDGIFGHGWWMPISATLAAMILGATWRR